MRIDENEAIQIVQIFKSLIHKEVSSINDHSVQRARGIVVEGSDAGDNAIVRLNVSLDDSSQNFEAVNLTGSHLASGDAVLIDYWDELDNAVINYKIDDKGIVAPSYNIPSDGSGDPSTDESEFEDIIEAEY